MSIANAVAVARRRADASRATVPGAGISRAVQRRGAAPARKRTPMARLQTTVRNGEALAWIDFAGPNGRTIRVTARVPVSTVERAIQQFVRGQVAVGAVSEQDEVAFLGKLIKGAKKLAKKIAKSKVAGALYKTLKSVGPALPPPYGPTIMAATTAIDTAAKIMKKAKEGSEVAMHVVNAAKAAKKVAAQLPAATKHTRATDGTPVKLQRAPMPVAMRNAPPKTQRAFRALVTLV